MNRFTVIAGDGFSHNLTNKVIDFLKSIKVPLNIDLFHGTPNKTEFAHILDSVKENKVALKGFWTTPLSNSFESINHAFRRDLDLWANVVHVKAIPSISRKQDFDFIVVRQNTEGEYSQIEHECHEGDVMMYKVMTAMRSQQIANFGFKYAKSYKRTKITCVHKANIMKMGDGLFLSTCRDVATKYPCIEFKDLIVDNTAMQLVMRPSQFDVMLLPNLYGNIMISIGAGLVGSSGLLVGANYSDDLAVFESATRSVANQSHSPAHLNPISLILAYCHILRRMDKIDAAKPIEECINRMIVEKISLTPDIGGTSTTDEFLEKCAVEYNVANKC